MNQIRRVDFITDLLQHKNLGNSQKERLFHLVGEEIKKIGETDEVILTEIAELKKKIEEIRESRKIDVNAGNKIKKEHRPKDVANFMALFNKRDGLKYLTHDYDEDGQFDIENFLKKAKEIFSIETRKLSIPVNLWQIVNQFAFDENPSWGEIEGAITEGFSSKKWIQWSKENKLHPIRNQNEFLRIIEKFRALTRIEAPNLQTIIEESTEDAFKDIKMNVSMSRLDKADFYSHVPSFKKALEIIFREIVKRSSFKNVSIEYYGKLNETGEYYIVNLAITHYDSFPPKPFDQLLSEWKSEKGSIDAIKNKLFGYCDWSIETKIDEKPYRINLLKEPSIEDYVEIPDENVKGFKHILTFYYKVSE